MEDKNCETCRYEKRNMDESPCNKCCDSFCGIPFDPWNWEPKKTNPSLHQTSIREANNGTNEKGKEVSDCACGGQYRFEQRKSGVEKEAIGEIRK